MHLNTDQVCMVWKETLKIASRCFVIIIFWEIPFCFCFYQHCWSLVNHDDAIFWQCLHFKRYPITSLLQSCGAPSLWFTCTPQIEEKKSQKSINDWPNYYTQVWIAVSALSRLSGLLCQILWKANAYRKGSTQLLTNVRHFAKSRVNFPKVFSLADVTGCECFSKVAEMSTMLTTWPGTQRMMKVTVIPVINLVILWVLKRAVWFTRLWSKK